MQTRESTCYYITEVFFYTRRRIKYFHIFGIILHVITQSSIVSIYFFQREKEKAKERVCKINYPYYIIMLCTFLGVD